MAATTDDMTTLSAPAATTASAWRLALPALVAVLGGLLGLFWDTLTSMTDIWARSETFAHGYVIAPLSFWLVWRRRAELAAVTPRPGYAALSLLLLAGFGWLLARLTGVLVVEQLAFVAMIPLAIWAVLGWPVVRQILFPLAFLFFMVPMGEGLIPPMMDFTAFFTVRMLQLTGIPVFWEGTFFTIPSGQWSVVEGCSGVRYLIASITLGTLYAYLTYQSYWKRAIFIALSVIVPIFANGMRAYIIVMIAHLSDMALAVGIDHFIYGWVWFGIVMMILFWVGSFWRDEEPAPTSARTPPVSGSMPQVGSDGLTAGHPSSAGTLAASASASASAAAEGAARASDGAAPRPAFARFAVAVIATLVVAALAPGAQSAMQASGPAGPVALTTPAPAAGWSASEELLADWVPHYEGMDTLLHRTYRGAGKPVGLFLAWYGGREPGRELVTSTNMVVKQKDPKWRMPSETGRSVQLGSRDVSVREAVLRSDGQSFLVWRWYWIGGDHTANEYLAKLLEARDAILFRRAGEAGIVVYTPLEGTPDDERQTLQRYLDATLPAIVASLEGISQYGINH